MNPKYKDTETIDLYLDNILSDQERIAFEQRLENEPELAHELEMQCMTNKIIIGNELLELKKQMQQDLGVKKPANKYRLNYNIIVPVLFFLGALTCGIYFNEYIKPKEEVVSTEPLRNDVKHAASVDSVPALAEVVEVKSNQQKPMQANKKPKPEHLNTTDDQAVISFKEEAKPKEEKKAEVLPFDKKEEQSTPEKLAVAALSTTPEVAKINCNALKVSADIEIKETCTSENEGTIKIKTESIQGGKAPYRFGLNKENIDSSSQFLYLREGFYNVYVKDASGCTVLLKENLEVKAKECRKQMHFTFTPAIENTWKIPVDESRDARVKIINKSGLPVFDTSVHSGEIIEWSGRDMNGNEVPAGYYIFVFEYEDKQIEQGSVTILK